MKATGKGSKYQRNEVSIEANRDPTRKQTGAHAVTVLPELISKLGMAVSYTEGDSWLPVMNVLPGDVTAKLIPFSSLILLVKALK